jgi:putative ABC transport system ATP-binding protein
VSGDRAKKDPSAIIEAEGLTKVYSMGKVQVVALNDVSLSIPRGSFMGITGLSDSGKSTFLNLIGGLDTPTSGAIHVRGKTISHLSNEELARYRRIDVGMIFQSFSLIPSLTAVENVALPLGSVSITRRATEISKRYFSSKQT